MIPNCSNHNTELHHRKTVLTCANYNKQQHTDWKKKPPQNKTVTDLQEKKSVVTLKMINDQYSYFISTQTGPLELYSPQFLPSNLPINGLGPGPGGFGTGLRMKGLGSATPNTFMRLSLTEYSILKCTTK